MTTERKTSFSLHLSNWKTVNLPFNIFFITHCCCLANKVLHKELVAGWKHSIYSRIYLRAISDYMAKNSMTFYALWCVIAGATHTHGGHNLRNTDRGLKLDTPEHPGNHCRRLIQTKNPLIKLNKKDIVNYCCCNIFHLTFLFYRTLFQCVGCVRVM